MGVGEGIEDGGNVAAVSGLMDVIQRICPVPWVVVSVAILKPEDLVFPTLVVVFTRKVRLRGGRGLD